MKAGSRRKTGNKMDAIAFQEQVLTWFDQHGRKDLPWQQTISPYRVWLSEIMLQQTQVQTVIPYFLAFIDQFPDVESLAKAPLDEVLSLWAGLGYYARARNLHKTAEQIKALGRFPDNVAELIKLPGIGLSTAGAISSIAFNNSAPILDGNVKRVFSRYMAIPGWPGDTRVAKQLWQLSSTFTPKHRVADYTQAMMDLGATVCTRSNPNCAVCPLVSACLAFQTKSVKDYPAAKITRTLPVKTIVFLILENDCCQILLEKRPPTGIWGGLWSLPEFIGEQDAVAWCETHRIEVLSKKIGVTQRHSFSHFHLEYYPLTITASGDGYRLNEPGRWEWICKKKLNTFGVPAPVKQLLLNQLKGK
jgi:A/G-specific adenine glycosylase